MKRRIVLPVTLKRVAARRGGVALVSVLLVIVLVTVLIVGFLARAGTERVAASNFNAAAATNRLAGTAINLVESQINEATAATVPGDLSWASQPGAIRTFGKTGALQSIFRLYSATAQTAHDANDLAADIPDASWRAFPAIWTDLNAPVPVGGLKDASGASLGNAYPIYPILDPRLPSDVGKQVAIDGFALDSANPVGASVATPYMPVRWLYVLQSGTLVTPTDASGTQVKARGATRVDPIVGRIAFWTDDETCKVNVNTAGGSDFNHPKGVYPAPWETPRFNSIDDLKLFSQNQPVSGEYPRYPGHPATTSLYRIFKGLGIPTANVPDCADYPYTPTNYPAVSSASANSSNPSASPSALFHLLPRYNDDRGSQGGTSNTTLSNPPLRPSAKPNGMTNARLYASLGEMLYDPTRVRTGVTRQQLETGKFLLTAHSRAPEVNLFGTPRVSIWPVPYVLSTNPNTNRASGFDRLTAFCATTNATAAPCRYYFQRNDSRSATTDATLGNNGNLYNYLYMLTSKGAAAGTGGDNVPGFTGGTLSAKYEKKGVAPLAWYQILTEIVDYIRCTNVYDHSLSASRTAIPRYTESSGSIGSPGGGQVVPLKMENHGLGTTRGLGRMFTFSEISLVIICTADGNGLARAATGAGSDWRSVSNIADDGQGTRATLKTAAGASLSISPNVTLADNAPTTATPHPVGMPLAAGQKRLQAILVFEPNCPMQNYSELYPDWKIAVKGMENLRIGGVAPFPASVPTLAGACARIANTFSFGGLQGARFFVSGENLGSNPTSLVGVRTNGWRYPGTNAYPLVSNPFTVTAASTGGTMSLETIRPVTVEISVPTSAGVAASPVVQTFNLTFPTLSAGLPVPDLLQTGLTCQYYDNATRAIRTASGGASDWWGFDNRIAWVKNAAYDVYGPPVDAPNYGLGCLFRNDADAALPGTAMGGWTPATSAAARIASYKAQAGGPAIAADVVRSLIAPDGDVRLVAARETVTADGAADMVKSTGYDSSVKMADSLMDPTLSTAMGGCDVDGTLLTQDGAAYRKSQAPKVPGTPPAQPRRDWDNGLPNTRDGAYANKPDEGNVYTAALPGAATITSPYYDSPEQSVSSQGAQSYFSPNRIIASPVMFGSLPTGVMDRTPWRTLLFRPMSTDTSTGDTVISTNQHDTLGGPPDHLVLDLFNMPVVEPYAISEPFSTAGKVNMNYQIEPFTYITRSTALRAVLGSELLAKAPLQAIGNYKGKPGDGVDSPVIRLPLNLSDADGTLRQFKAKFAAGDIFRSASQICEIYLTPVGYGWSSDGEAYRKLYADPGNPRVGGEDFALVGDNVREKPYADIYPRLTTKSNTFTVHYQVQALRNPNTATGDPAVWDEVKGAVVGEHRGSATIERYIDPNRTDIPDYTVGNVFDASKKPLDAFYQWRVVESRRFAP